MSAELLDPTERERLLDRLVTAYLEAAEAGERPDRQEWLERHPALAAELAEFFADQDRVERVVAPLRQVAEAARMDETPDLERTTDSRGPGSTAFAGKRLGDLGDYELLQE